MRSRGPRSLAIPLPVGKIPAMAKCVSGAVSETPIGWENPAQIEAPVVFAASETRSLLHHTGLPGSG